MQNKLQPKRLAAHVVALAALLFVSAEIQGANAASTTDTTSNSSPATAAAKPGTASTAKPASGKSSATPTGATSGSDATAGAMPGLVPTPQSPADATAPETSGTTPPKLPTIVVTAATRTTQPIDTTATTTTVLNHQYLDDGKFALVPDALQTVPGLSVVTTGNPGGLTSVFIHGLESRQTLLTIDGRRQPVGLDGQNDNISNLTLDNLDQIEVVRTPVSTVQGGGAMGGVINLVTLSGKGVTTPEGSVSEEAGSFDTFRENAQSRGQVGDFDYAVSATRQDSSYPALSPGTPSAGDPGASGLSQAYRNTSYRGNFGYQITPHVYVDLHSAYNNAFTGTPGPYYSPDPTATAQLEEWNLSPEVVAKVTDFYSTRLYYNRDQQRQTGNDPYSLALYGGQGYIYRTQIDTDSADWQNDFQIAHNWSVTAGVQSDNHDFYQYDDGIGARTFEGYQSNIGGYISSQWQPLPGLNILNSGRYDAYSQYGGSFSWRQGASYLIAPTQTTVHASVGRAFTPPSLEDTVYSIPLYYMPNPNLQPETDLGWEAGVSQSLWDGKITPSATYFHNNVHNAIEVESVPDSFETTVDNVNSASTGGVEVGLAVKPCDQVTANLDYTYLNAVNDSTMTRLVRRPRNDLQFTITWKPIQPLTLTLGGDWVVDRQDLIFDPTTFASTQVKMPDYFVLRAAASYQINDTVSLWVRGENLTDKSYQPVAGYYAPDIGGYGGIKISF